MRLLILSILGPALFTATFRADRERTPRIIGFDDQKAGDPPRGFSCALTGQGRPGVWRVVRDETTGSRPNVLAQTDQDPTSYRFPVCVLDAVTATDVDVSVRFKPISGAKDQAAGLVWRYRDADNYYVVRANALEDNVVLYKVERGKRTDLDPKGSGLFAYGKKVDIPSGAWSTLRVVARGILFAVSVNDQQLFEVEDSTFSGPGRVGVWTKADSVTHFDDLSVAVGTGPAQSRLLLGGHRQEIDKLAVKLVAGFGIAGGNRTRDLANAIHFPDTPVDGSRRPGGGRFRPEVRPGGGDGNGTPRKSVTGAVTFTLTVAGSLGFRRRG